jgi:hypothetical protein
MDKDMPLQEAKEPMPSSERKDYSLKELVET